MSNPELAVIGLTCNVVGVFFLANSIRFREPKKAVEEVLGAVLKSLDRARDTALNNMQVMIGFLFLTAGFLLQVMGQWEQVGGEIATLSICAGIVGFAAAVYFFGAYSSRRAFKKVLRDYFQREPWSFDANMALTKEIGTLFGVERTPDMTVETYVHRVRSALGVTLPPPDPNRPSTSDRTGGRRLRDLPLPGR
jgi:hypothetical protein